MNAYNNRFKIYVDTVLYILLLWSEKVLYNIMINQIKIISRTVFKGLQKLCTVAHLREHVYFSIGTYCLYNIL